MRRLLFNILTVMSLILFAACVFVGGRNMDLHESVHENGDLSIWTRDAVFNLERAEWHDKRIGIERREFSVLGLEFKFREVPLTKSPKSWTLLYIRIPLWMPIILSTILPALWLRNSRRRRRRMVRGECVGCGYTLCDAGATCPECGAKRKTPR